MKIGIIGTGYVGLPTGVGFAELENDVICVDAIKQKVNDLNSGKITLYEDGLEELFHKNVKKGKLKFTSSMEEGITNSDVVIIAVGTPPHPITKEADMKYIYAAAEELAEYLNDYTVIAIKSTVPVGTADDVEKIIKTKNPNANFDVISMPEFLREGFAVHDFFNPDRIIIGINSEKAENVIRELYKPFVDKTNILFVKRRSSETIKYASNAFLAIKVHYINEIANLCEKIGADIYEVAKGMGLDSRIGPKFLNPGPGYGGSCFPKDTMAMAYMADKYNVDLTLIKAAIKGNKNRKKDMANRILEIVKDIKDPKIAIWGLAFKEGTDDCRESPAIDIIFELLNSNVFIKAYDPKAIKTAKLLLQDKILYSEDMYATAELADILVVLTEWSEFRNPDLKKLYSTMKGKVIVDFRNCINPQEAIINAFKYYGFMVH